MDDENCGCAHVFIGKAYDTIVKLPTTCGLGPYARVVSLEKTAASARRGVGYAYALQFDYASVYFFPCSLDSVVPDHFSRS